MKRMIARNIVKHVRKFTDEYSLHSLIYLDCSAVSDCDLVMNFLTIIFLI